jgi:hypothetical protein
MYDKNQKVVDKKVDRIVCLPKVMTPLGHIADRETLHTF